MISLCCGYFGNSSVYACIIHMHFAFNIIYTVFAWWFPCVIYSGVLFAVTGITIQVQKCIHVSKLAIEHIYHMYHIISTSSMAYSSLHSGIL